MRVVTDRDRFNFISGAGVSPAYEEPVGQAVPACPPHSCETCPRENGERESINAVIPAKAGIQTFRMKPGQQVARDTRRVSLILEKVDRLP